MRKIIKRWSLVIAIILLTIDMKKLIILAFIVISSMAYSQENVVFKANHLKYIENNVTKDWFDVQTLIVFIPNYCQVKTNNVETVKFAYVKKIKETKDELTYLYMDEDGDLLEIRILFNNKSYNPVWFVTFYYNEYNFWMFACSMI